MGVTHSKVSTIADGSNEDLIRPSDWNAEHVLTDVGDIVGPASSVDNTVPRFDSTTGKLMQTSGIVIDDADAMTFNNAAAPTILSVAATATVPTLIPNKADLDTGLGWAGTNALSLIAGATEGIRITQTPIGTGQTVAGLSHILNAVLGADTGNEAAFTLNYTTNKLTSGDDTGLEINQTDTLSPGTSYGINYKVGGVSKFSVDSNGNIVFTGNIIVPTNSSIEMSSNGSGYIVVAPGGIYSYANNGTLLLQQRNFTVADNMIEMATGTFSNTSGNSSAVAIIPTYNQTSGTAANTDLLINRTETAVGSGEQLFLAMGTAALGVLTKFRNDGVYFPRQAPTASAPTYVEGGIYYDTTLHKLRVGGAAGWETITSS